MLLSLITLLTVSSVLGGARAGICQEVAAHLLSDSVTAAMETSTVEAAKAVAADAAQGAPAATSWWPSLGTVVKITAKVGATAAFGPWGGVAVDVVSAGVDVSSGNYVGAALTIGTTWLNFVPIPGFSGAATEEAAEVGKEAAVAVAREGGEAAAKEAAKEAGEELARNLATGGAQHLGRQLAYQTATRNAQEIAKESGRSLAKEFAKNTYTEAQKRSMIEATKATVNNLHKALGRQIGQQIADGTFTEIAKGNLIAQAREAAKEGGRAATKQWGEGLARDLARTSMQNMVDQSSREMLKRTARESLVQVLASGASGGASAVSESVVESIAERTVQEVLQSVTKEAAKSEFMVAAEAAIKQSLAQHLERVIFYRTVRDAAVNIVQHGVRNAVDSAAQDTGRALLNGALQNPAMLPQLAQWFVSVCA